MEKPVINHTYNVTRNNWEEYAIFEIKIREIFQILLITTVVENEDSFKFIVLGGNPLEFDTFTPKNH